jgi:hypothetical protein
LNKNEPFNFWVAEMLEPRNVMAWCSVLPCFSHPLKQHSNAEIRVYKNITISNKKIRLNALNGRYLRDFFDICQWIGKNFSLIYLFFVSRGVNYICWKTFKVEFVCCIEWGRGL